MDRPNVIVKNVAPNTYRFDYTLDGDSISVEGGYAAVSRAAAQLANGLCVHVEWI